MRNESKTIYAILTGGLGNQFFQLAAALNKAGQGKVVLVSNIGKPRKNSLGQPELCSFNLPPNVVLQDIKLESLSSKIFGYILRSGYSPIGLENNRYFERIIRFIGSIYFSLIIGRRLSVIQATDLGYFSKFNRILRTNSHLLIGYFQSYKFSEPEEVLSLMRKLENIEQSETFLNTKELALKTKFLVLHIRLTDYLFEKSFGILSPKYYALALENAFASSKYDEIWVFSDDVNGAKEALNLSNEIAVNWVSSELSTAESFQLMRMGAGLIIANSTFSWWAARLKYDPRAIVIAPDPWFLSMKEPNHLITSEWHRIKGFEN